MTQLVINFSRNFTAKISPLLINFGSSSGGGDNDGNPTDPTDELNNKDWLMIENVCTYSLQQSITHQFVFSSQIQQSLNHEVSLAHRNQDNLVVESGLKWQQQNAVKREWLTKYSLLAATQTERELIYLQLSKVETDYKIDWASQSTQTQNEFTFYFGPRDAEYICVPTKHPAPGVIYLSLDRPASNKQSPLSITLNDIAKVCYWSDVGLIRAFDDIPTIDRKVPIEPQIQNTYIMQPTITCKRVSDNREIYISNFAWSKSRGQFAATTDITFQTKLDFDYALNQLLEITVNGYVFYAYCETPGISRSFNNREYRCSGRSRIAELSQPYVRPTNYTNTVDRTHAGICSDILQNTGWLLQYSMVDYAVPAESFSYVDKASASALNDVAKAIGAMLDVGESTKTINVVPFWPVQPWRVDAATCDIILNESHIDSHNSQFVNKLAANAVFVSGQQNGVACKIRRDNTAGDLTASDVVDSLITDNQAARQRGECELGNAGNKEESTVVTDIKADLPPIKLGSLVGIQYPGELYKATCDSLTINASVDSNGAIDVTQTVKLVKNV
ncbi:hypothetical protein [Pseudoalteromonas spongiae]|uniref:hypothetical protein n=1 Tax=Pseudoalteromonas spongiae TaxID=298657 RepID=UPI000C2D5F68|nr:hypothetical protein [Pseudoalteromonas spongiae]